MFERQPLRNAVQREILSRLADGRLPAGKRINETHLATALGISRTPLREAMLNLEAAGFLASDMGRGFVVPPLAAREFTELAAVLARLEPLALSQTMPYSGQRLMELNNLLGRSKLRVLPAGSERSSALMDLIARWAYLLVEPCPNAVLSQDILRLEGLGRRYWFRAAAEGFEPAPLVASLEELYELIRSGQSARAASHWSEHVLRFGQEAGRLMPVNRAGAVDS